MFNLITIQRNFPHYCLMNLNLFNQCLMFEWGLRWFNNKDNIFFIFISILYPMTWIPSLMKGRPTRLHASPPWEYYAWGRVNQPFHWITYKIIPSLRNVWPILLCASIHENTMLEERLADPSLGPPLLENPSWGKLNQPFNWIPSDVNVILEEVLVNPSPCSPSMKILFRRKNKPTLPQYPNYAKIIIEEGSINPYPWPPFMIIPCRKKG